MTQIDIRTKGCAGRITLTRPEALNALSYEMILAIDEALMSWASDRRIRLVILDAEGDKAFCAGGDIAELYRTGIEGDFEFGRKFWSDEYRMNARISRFAKPFVTFMQGFVMGGGVGIGCHGSHRIVCETTRIALPECGVGLVPDVGGSLLLARAPGHLGEYVGTTGYRMNAGDSICLKFADLCVNRSYWPSLISELCNSADLTCLETASGPTPDSPLSAHQAWIDQHFGGETFRDIVEKLQSQPGVTAAETLGVLSKNSPLSMACTVEIIQSLRSPGVEIGQALDLEFRFTSRAMEHGDFLEGIRAAIIDKDRAPLWRHPLSGPTANDTSNMLAPLGNYALNLDAL